MTPKEAHDVLSMLSPALTYTQNMRLGFYGDLNEKQSDAALKIEKCIKDLTNHVRANAQAAAE